MIPVSATLFAGSDPVIPDALFSLAAFLDSYLPNAATLEKIRPALLGLSPPGGARAALYDVVIEKAKS